MEPWLAGMRPQNGEWTDPKWMNCLDGRNDDDCCADDGDGWAASAGHSGSDAGWSEGHAQNP